MRSIIYDVAVSIDGFICGVDDDVSAFPHQGPHVAAYQDRLAGYESVIMGRRTYEFGYRFGLLPGARAYPHMDHHIFSRGIALPGGADVTVVRADWRGALDRLRGVPGGDIYLCGGGAFAGWVAGQGLLARLRVKRAPVLLGAGVRLFEGAMKPLALRLEASQVYGNGVVYADYAVGS